MIGGSPGGWAAATNPEELGAPGEGIGEGEETTTALEPSTETVWAWPAGSTAEVVVGEIIAVEDALAPPEDGPATTTPTEASAAALSMMTDTTMANPTARSRGDQRWAFIPYLGDGIYGVPEHRLQGSVREPANPPFVRRESFLTLTRFSSDTRSLAGVTTLVSEATARRLLYKAVVTEIKLSSRASAYNPSENLRPSGQTEWLPDRKQGLYQRSEAERARLPFVRMGFGAPRNPGGSNGRFGLGWVQGAFMCYRLSPVFRPESCSARIRVDRARHQRPSDLKERFRRDPLPM